MNEWHSANEIIKRSKIAESTARRYMSQFSEYFSTEKAGRQRRYSGEAVRILQRISELFELKRTADDIREILSREYAMTIEPEQEKKEQPSRQLAIVEHLQEQNKALAQALTMMTDKLTESMAESRASREELELLKQRLDKLEQKTERKWYHIFKR
jgi:DNA-binding transcriptional MerR regulator